MNTTITPEQLLHQLKWRYATKQFDATKKISDREFAALEEAILLSPSSFGVQPWGFVVVKNPELRAKLRAASWGQAQITDASHLIVFTSKANLSEADIDAFIERAIEVREVPTALRGAHIEGLKQYRGMIVGSLFQGMDAAARAAWCRNQVYIALGNLLTSAALLGIDACPMEGIDRAQYDTILGLKEKGLTTAMVATLGYRSANDKYATQAKVRFPKEKVFIEI